MSPTSWTGRFSIDSLVTRNSDEVRSRRTRSALAVTTTSSVWSVSEVSEKSVVVVRSTFTRTPSTRVWA